MKYYLKKRVEPQLMKHIIIQEISVPGGSALGFATA